MLCNGGQRAKRNDRYGVSFRLLSVDNIIIIVDHASDCVSYTANVLMQEHRSCKTAYVYDLKAEKRCENIQKEHTKAAETTEQHACFINQLL